MNIKPAIASVRNAVAANKDTIKNVALVTSVTIVAIQRLGLKQHDDFLKEHGLFDAFWNTED